MPYNAMYTNFIVTALHNSECFEIQEITMNNVESNNFDAVKAAYQKPALVELTVQFTQGGMAGVFEFNVNGMNTNRKDQGTS
jgi:hypothetical protein